MSDAGERIVAHRRGHVLPIRDADDFFGKLRDRIQTLARTHRQDPRTVDVLVQSTKRFSSRPEHAIELHDLLDSELRRVLHHLETSTPPISYNSDEIRSLCAFYESAMEPLARMFGVLGRWGDGSDQDFVANAVLILWDHEGGASSGHAHFRRYAAVLLIWSYGAGLTVANRWSALHGLLSYRIANDRGEQKRVVDLLGEWFLAGYRNNIWKHLPGLENHRTPDSDHLFDILCTWRDSFAPVLADFEGLYDIWEILVALAYGETYATNPSDNKLLPFWTPIGRNSWRYHSRQRILRRIASGDLRHPLVAAGFGGREDEHLLATINSYSDFITTLPLNRYM